jgi:hypothetical protein
MTANLDRESTWRKLADSGQFGVPDGGFAAPSGLFERGPLG